MKPETFQKIAEHYEALAQIFRKEANLPFQSPTIQEEARKNGSNVLNVQCGCDKPAKRVEGTVKTGKKIGEPYVMYVCSEGKNSPDNCGFRKFEDQLI
jgi:ubiquinone/menaquinone biosynthesis C-methylase UbiE